MGLKNILKKMIMAKEAVEVAIENYYDSNLEDLDNANEHLEQAIDQMLIYLGMAED